jgi:hypothetical protein
MTQPFAMVRMTTRDINAMADQWENSPGGGPGSYEHYWQACLQAGAYVPVNDQDTGYYYFHPEKLARAWELLSTGTDAYTLAGKQAAKASNVTCMWHRKALKKGATPQFKMDARHADDSICTKPRPSRQPAQKTATTTTAARPGGRSA